MTSLRHNPEAERRETERTAADAGLDAAREAILAVGWSRTTLTDIARRAGVSRMTLYRNWPDMGSLLADLMTREWSSLMQVDTDGGPREQLVRSAVATVRAIRSNPLFARIIELDPELLLPYLLERPGRAQGLVLELVTGQIRLGQEAGEIRSGDAELLARAIVLAAHGFTLSAQTMTKAGITEAGLDDELARLLESYLKP
jgi:AcrR family transcriptional regulator